MKSIMKQQNEHLLRKEKEEEQRRCNSKNIGNRSPNEKKTYRAPTMNQLEDLSRQDGLSTTPVSFLIIRNGI